jgi:hypothetical protein
MTTLPPLKTRSCVWARELVGSVAAVAVVLFPSSFSFGWLPWKKFAINGLGVARRVCWLSHSHSFVGEAGERLFKSFARVARLHVLDQVDVLLAAPQLLLCVMADPADRRVGGQRC